MAHVRSKLAKSSVLVWKQQICAEACAQVSGQTLLGVLWRDAWVKWTALETVITFSWFNRGELRKAPKSLMGMNGRHQPGSNTHHRINARVQVYPATTGEHVNERERERMRERERERESERERERERERGEGEKRRERERERETGEREREREREEREREERESERERERETERESVCFHYHHQTGREMIVSVFLCGQSNKSIITLLLSLPYNGVYY